MPRRSMRALAGYLGLFVALLPLSASSQSAPLRVTRGAGSEDCPDSVSLADTVAAIRGARWSGGPGGEAYSVAFSREASLYRASIAPDNASAERSLESAAPNCAALARAAAVTLALLYDAASSSPPPSAAAAVSGERLQLGLALLGALQLGVVHTLSPALGGELGLFAARWRIQVGALFTPQQTIALTPGEVTVSLWRGSGRACLAPWTKPLRFDVCLGAQLGAARAAAHGFSTNRARTRPYLAVPLELAASYLTSRLGVELAAAAIAPLLHDEFTIDGRASAYRPARVGAALTLRLWWLLQQ